MAGRSGKAKGFQYPVLTVYYLTLAAFFAASFFPESRLWGINWWGYYSLAVRMGLFVIGCALPPILTIGLRQGDAKRSNHSNRAFLTFAISGLIVAGALFYLLRGRTHFLGDGYLLLSSLASEQSFIKLRNLGSMGLPKLLMALLPGSAEARALLGYQITSIVAGLLFLGLLLLAARSLFKAIADRLLFVGSLAVGGWMLLFFGYVENYALFAVAVLAFGLVGLLICQREMNRWWILLAQGVALFFHVFGAALVPATIYLLISDSELGLRISRLNAAVKWIASLAAVVIAVVVFYHFYTTDYFFRFAFVPPVGDKFTVDGYTLFSGKHLLDFGGLLLMLLPGLPVLLVSLLSPSGVRLWSSRESRFLMLATVFALGCAFVFDPRLGMPRDWDLFSFCGIPLGLLLTWHIVKGSSNPNYRHAALLMGIGLSALVLVPRVITQADAERSCAVAKNYINLDKSKTSAARFLLAQYYVKQGDTATRDRLNREWAKDLALNEQFHSAYQLTLQGKYADAYPTLRRIVEIQPNLHQAWTLLADCYEQAGMFDSALYCLRVSDGLNPYNAGIQSDIGTAYYKMKDLDNAERYLRKAIGLDSLITPPQLGLARIYKDRREIDSFLNVLLPVTRRPNTPPEFYHELIDYYLEAGQFEQASRTLTEGISKGLDSAYVQDVRQRHPELK